MKIDSIESMATELIVRVIVRGRFETAGYYRLFISPHIVTINFATPDINNAFE